MDTFIDCLQAEARLHPSRPVMDFSGEHLEAQCEARRKEILEHVLGLPERFPVSGIVTSRHSFADYRREEIVIESEPGSWQTAQLYLPTRKENRPLPAIILASGHGGSKAHGYNQLAAQIYTRLGCAVLVPDPIGEEERNEPYGLGLRGHRLDFAIDRLNELARPFLGKVIGDLRAALDYLRQRSDIAADRIGCAGSSMGGTVVQLLLAVETGFRAGIISSWAADYHCFNGTQGCCFRLPGLLRLANQIDLMALAAPHCALLVCSGEQDEITPPHGLAEMAPQLEGWWKHRGAPEQFCCRIESEGGHRPYHLTPFAMAWLVRHLGIATEVDFSALPTISLGEIYERAGRSIEALYNEERHHRGTRIPDWPLNLESPEDLRVLKDGVLGQLGLNPANFSLTGYLHALGSAPLDRVPSLPVGLSSEPAAAQARASTALAILMEVPTWFGITKTQTESGEDWPLGYAGCQMRIWPSAQGDDEIEIFLSATRGRQEAPSQGSAGTPVTFDLVCFNDNETLLNISSLATNVFLIRQGLRQLQRRFPHTNRWILRSEIPRLGELIFFQEPILSHFILEAGLAVEKARVCVGRAENILPGSARHLRWIDLFLGALPRTQQLPATYFTPEACALLRGKGISVDCHS